MKRLYSKEEIEDIAKRAQDRIGVHVRMQHLIIEALTHPSFSHESNGEYPSYDRLEFLGDGVLNFVVGEELLRRGVSLNEGDLTVLRSAIISRNGLATAARDLDLGEFLLLGGGEEKTGGRDRDSTLSDVFESLVGAVYIDLGFDRAKEMVLSLLSKYIDEALSNSSLHNPKGRLQEYAMRKFREYPKYRVMVRRGRSHSPFFVVEVSIPSAGIASRGEGRSKKEAEQAAALNALKSLDDI